MLQIDGKEALFESNAIAEYLDETARRGCIPRIRSRGRATARGPTTCRPSPSDIEHDVFGFRGRVPRRPKIAMPFEKLDEALARRGNDGPFFNGPKFSLVDAAYAPFLQRYFFLDRVRKLGHIERFPRLRGWAERPDGAPLDPFVSSGRVRGDYRENLKRRNKWISRFIEVAPSVAAE